MPLFLFVSEQLLKFNGLSSSVTFLEKYHDQVCLEDLGRDHLDAIIGEPFFTSSLLPWHNLHYWYAVESLKKLVAAGVVNNSVLFPGAASLMAIAGEGRGMEKVSPHRLVSVLVLRKKSQVVSLLVFHAVYSYKNYY